MTPLYTMALQARARPQPDDPVLVFFPQRCTHPHIADVALGLLAILMVKNGITRGLPPLSDIAGAATTHHWIGGHILPVGAWVLATRASCPPIDETVTTLSGAFGVSTARHAWPTAEAFVLPRHTYTSPQRHRTSWTSPWWDSVGVGLLLGAIEARLPLAFTAESAKETLSKDWMYALIGSAARVLHPWLGNPNLPRQGYGSRAFPVRASKARALQDMPSLLAHTSHAAAAGRFTLREGWITTLSELGILVPDAPYAPTAWVKGPHWERAIAKFPPALLAAGREAGNAIPGRISEISPADILDRCLDGTTGHARLAQMAAIAMPDRVLTTLLPDLARGPRRKTAP